MLKRTNINITDGTAIMPYLVEYLDSSDNDNTSYTIWYHKDDEKRECWLDISYEAEHEHLYSRENYWEKLEMDDEWHQWNSGHYSDDLPVALLKVYFPQYSVETYYSHIYYIVKAITYFQDWKINIGCYLMNRIDSLACAPVRYLDAEYYEYQKIDIPDIWAIIYSEAFRTLRETITGESLSESEVNDDCSLLSIEIIPATAQDNYFVKHETYFSSENAIEIFKGDSDFMNLSIKQVFDESTHIPQISAKLNFNDVYEDILADYIKETYSINSSAIQTGKIWIDYCLSIMNEDDIFKMQIIKKQVQENETNSSSAKFYGEQLYFENWAYLDKIIHFKCIACITYRSDADSDGEVLMEIPSDDLPITQDIYRWWINRNQIDTTVNHINITEDDMNILACNKIIKNIITVPRPDNYKANIMKPVFFKSYDTEQIYIYSNANCTVAINLTRYYSQVEYFKIQIGDFVVHEYGRNASGVLFKIDAVALDKSVEAGIYYILDENDEVICDGNYIFKDKIERRIPVIVQDISDDSLKDATVIDYAVTSSTNSDETEASSSPVKINGPSSSNIPTKLEKQLKIVTNKTDMLIPKSFKEKADPIKLATLTPTPNKIKR